METIKVNMNPNPLDVQTIHASQNDTEARQWGFELHNNGELIDTSDVTDQIVFKAYKGGTEQILPENTSTPTTSPFKGDIKYPQGLLSGQEFLYRESPTESDGLAKITDIKGNTLVWNQLVQNGNFVDTSNWTRGSLASYSAINNIYSFTPSAQFGGILQVIPFINGHKYFYTFDIYGTNTSNRYKLQINGTQKEVYGYYTNSWHTENGIYNCQSSANGNYYLADLTTSNWSQIQVRRAMIFDLTQMGLDISSPSDFTSLFSLPYYDYNTGSMLSFNGTGLKIVGFNLAERWSSGNTSAGYANALGVECELLPNTSYCVSFVGNSGNRIYPNESLFTNTARITCNGSRQFVVLTTLANISKATTSQYQSSFGWRIFKNDGNNTVNSVFSDVCVNFNNSSRNGEYEPYTESTLSLPISTYFPTGMKSAGTAYDELTPNKATTRLKEVTFSSVSAFDSSGKLGVLGSATDAVNITRGDEVPNDRAVLETYSLERLRNNDVNGITQFGRSFFVRLQGKTTLAEYNTYLSANPLSVIYELATPTETSFTTASLVTENAEIPLSNEDGVLIGKCTEELSENPGFIDAKIKLSDADGTCYSNKLQLHVERSPQ